MCQWDVDAECFLNCSHLFCLADLNTTSTCQFNSNQAQKENISACCSYNQKQVEPSLSTWLVMPCPELPSCSESLASCLWLFSHWATLTSQDHTRKDISFEFRSPLHLLWNMKASSMMRGQLNFMSAEHESDFRSIEIARVSRFSIKGLCLMFFTV